MTPEISAQAMLDAFKEDAPGHVDGTRWAHTHGIGVLGRFVASDVAARYCVASPFHATSVPVTARLSNGSSDPQRYDNRPDTRGLAVKFHCDDGSEYDLLSMTLGAFGAQTREEFLEVSKAFVPKPVVPETWFRRNILDPLMLRQPQPTLPAGVTINGGFGLAQYAGTHAFARAFVLEAGEAQVPVSWGRTAYHAVHAFVVVSPDGTRNAVRFSWQPVDGVFPVPPDQMQSLTTDFLTAEMRARLAHAPVRFTLKMTFADPGDDTSDPSTPWPITRRAVTMGTLYIEKMAVPEQVDVEHMSFNPMRLIAGIEPSDDAILRARGEIYQLGCRERRGTGCPLHATSAERV